MEFPRDGHRDGELVAYSLLQGCRILRVELRKGKLKQSSRFQRLCRYDSRNNTRECPNFHSVQSCKDLQGNLTVEEAILKFYKSKIGSLLGKEDAKLWHLGWVALYDMYKEEVYGY